MREGTKVYPNETTNTQVKTFANFNDKLHTDTYANLLNCYIYDQAVDQHVLSNILYYNMPVGNAPIFDEINGVPEIIANTTRIANLSSFTEELSSARPRNRLVTVHSVQNQC